ncbi:hypothetical protein AALP_AA8G080100 [Arabis alpina]|uniref:C2H2-type domain-containing protein n=1 Tax=Arabis alpina TaxID=50452 RepID=A0A087G5P6_ARAAL|nr:hypothetical protein AALP_AA8G080100 [Arabis alpina]
MLISAPRPPSYPSTNEWVWEFYFMLDENNDVISYCKVLDYHGFDECNMTIPWTGEDLSQNVSCLSVDTFHRRNLEKERSNIPRGFNKTIGVWWIPDGCIRSRIESALHEYIGHACSVTIFCVGNLEYISPQVLKAISSSGIHLRHTLIRGRSVISLLDEWEKQSKSFPTCTSTHLWDWESLLLEENDSCLVDTNSGKDDEPHLSWFCTMCNFPSPNCDDFVNHLKSTSHSQELWSMVRVDENNETPIFCEICNYPSYDKHNMRIHLYSEEHAAHKLIKPETQVKKKKDPVAKARKEAIKKSWDCRVAKVVIEKRRDYREAKKIPRRKDQPLEHLDT